MDHFYQSLPHGSVPGWFEYQELYSEMVQRFPSGSTFVEIGVYAGCSFAFLGVEMVNAGKKFNLIAVDNYGFISAEQVTQNLSPLAGKFKTVVGDSAAVAANYEDGSIDFAFIDANHEAHAIRADIKAWLPKMKHGGVLAGHDYNLPNSGMRVWGVTEVVDEIFGDNKRLTQGCWVVEMDSMEAKPPNLNG